jgi:nucleolar protein 58
LFFKQTALAIRVDALAETSEPTIALESRAKVESRIRQLEGGQRLVATGGAKASSGAQRYDADAARAQAPPRFNTASDVVGISANGEAEGEKKKKKKKKDKEAEDEEPAAEDGEKKKKKKKKDRERAEDDDEGEPQRKRKSSDADAEDSGEKKKKKKKKSQEA